LSSLRCNAVRNLVKKNLM